MKFTSELRYPRPVDTVMKMFTDRRYFERKYQALEVSNFAVFAHARSAQRFSIGCRFSAVGQTRLPDFARRFVGDSIRVKQTDTWQIADRVGEIDIEISGAPASVHADMRLEPVGRDASVVRLDWEVRCAIPLLGGKVERIIADDVRRRVEADGVVSVRLLQGYA